MRIVITSMIGLAIIGYTVYDQREYLFTFSAEDICRKAYGVNPFHGSLSIGEYINKNSDQNDTVAVLGSEPQICFYAMRRSATSYIYMYPLMESNPQAQRMQLDMISQIEKAKPKIMVFAAVNTSWLNRPGSPQDIFNWSETYINDSYDKVGLIDIPKSGRDIYYWDDMAKNKSPESKYWVAVFKRRN